MRRPRRRARPQGQLMIAAIVLLLSLALLVPLMVAYSQHEASWTVKQARSTTALHLAEAGVEKAYLRLTLSTGTWANIQAGSTSTPVADYNFDKEYSDVAGGTYAISITSGPQKQEATVISVGRDASKNETRAIKVVYSNSPLGGVALFSGKGADVGGGVTVEWGGIVSPEPILLGSALTYPQFWSASYIQPFITTPNPPYCDSPNCCQWHAYDANLPPSPAIDLGFYASSATASICPTTSGVGSGASTPNGCYFPTSQNWSGVTLYGPTVYINGDLTVSAPGIDIMGNLIVTGNLILPTGNFGNGNHPMPIPSDAWKQYCNDWSHYQTFDPGAPPAFPGLNSNYAPTGLVMAGTGKTAVYGLLYVGGNIYSSGSHAGGGQGDVYGAMYVVGTSTMTQNSGVTLYFDEGAASNLQTTTVVLTRASWQDSLTPWPSALP